MDQLSAHIDRGWDLAERGDALGAQASAQKALELEPESPEAHNLLGFVNALAGDCDEAIEAYQHAAMLDDTYVEAMLNAAELLLHPVGDADAAISMCNQALDATTYPEEILEARLLTLEALLLKGEREQARTLMRTVTQNPLQNPAHCFLAARAFMELDDDERAGPLLEAAIEGEPHNPEAQYYQGLWFERQGDRRGACGAFLRTRQLDLELGLPPWAPNAESFLLFAQRAIEQLDPRLVSYAQHAEVYIADVPGSEMVVDGVDPRALAMVDIAFNSIEAAQSGGPLLPEQVSTRIFLYALNVLRVASGLHNVQSCMQEALNEELATAIDDLQAMAEQALSEGFEPIQPFDPTAEALDPNAESPTQLGEAPDQRVR